MQLIMLKTVCNVTWYTLIGASCMQFYPNEDWQNIGKVFQSQCWYQRSLFHSCRS